MCMYIYIYMVLDINIKKWYMRALLFRSRLAGGSLPASYCPRSGHGAYSLAPTGSFRLRGYDGASRRCAPRASHAARAPAPERAAGGQSSLSLIACSADAGRVLRCYVSCEQVLTHCPVNIYIYICIYT